jgi:hypothetical protein
MVCHRKAVTWLNKPKASKIHLFKEIHENKEISEKIENLSINKIDRNWKTVRYDELPGWYEANPYLLQGHRPELKSVKLCLLSIFRVHTETANIWTHLTG